MLVNIMIDPMHVHTFLGGVVKEWVGVKPGPWTMDWTMDWTDARSMSLFTH